MSVGARDTIFALSSGQPPAAIAIVRISGPSADPAIETLAGRLPEPRRASLATLQAQGGEILDRALVLRFPGPNSATGEDLAELHLHGGRSVVAAVLAALGRIEGLRPAEAGEFTRRAFENGRIDLAEAEGLADLLTAETESQRKAALALAGGALSRKVDAWQERLLGLAAQVEAALDFSDDLDEEELPASWEAQLRILVEDVDGWLERPSSERLKDGIRIVIAGPPNAGKSTLLNALAGREAAITSAIPGTTRDIVEAPTAIAGMPFLLVDTAGLRDADDTIERVGIARAEAMIERADLVLWLGEPDEAPARSIIVSSKTDVEPVAAGADVAVSPITGAGMTDLLRLVETRCRSLLPVEGEVALNRRHRERLAEVAAALTEAQAARDLLIRAEVLRQARAGLDRITGRAGVEEMLDALFGRFCIGK